MTASAPTERERLDASRGPPVPAAARHSRPGDVDVQFEQVRRRRRMGRATRWTLAAVNLVLAVVGVFVPILQAWLHALIAVALVAPDWPFARRLTLGLFRRLPRIRRRLPPSIRELTRPDHRPEDRA